MWRSGVLDKVDSDGWVEGKGMNGREGGRGISRFDARK